METDHHMARMASRRGAIPSRIAIDGQMHLVISLPAMEGIGHENAGSITYPAPGAPGWATTRVGSHRFAAWFTGEDAS